MSHVVLTDHVEFPAQIRASSTPCQGWLRAAEGDDLSFSRDTVHRSYSLPE